MSNIEILEQALKLRPDERYKVVEGLLNSLDVPDSCLLYTSDAADERSSVDLGGRRIFKKKKKK